MNIMVVGVLVGAIKADDGEGGGLAVDHGDIHCLRWRSTQSPLAAKIDERL